MEGERRDELDVKMKVKKATALEGREGTTKQCRRK